MFEPILKKYINKGYFSFMIGESLEYKCNAPTDRCGVYLIYKTINAIEELLYIGSSGQMKDGKLKIRQSGLGGMKDRLVNGYHPKFGKVRRKKAFPNQMQIENISEIKIYWWVTYNDEYFDIPTDVETSLKNGYIEKYGCKPPWHK